jgi:hypothetical protein
LFIGSRNSRRAGWVLPMNKLAFRRRAFDTRPGKTGATQAERICSLAQQTRAARVGFSGRTDLATFLSSARVSRISSFVSRKGI